MKIQTENLGKVAPTYEGGFDITKSYDSLCCVVDGKTGASYMSRRPVPKGTNINDEYYWQIVSIGANRIILTETLGNSTVRAVTQKFITELWNAQYEFNDSVKDSVELCKKVLGAIELLSPDQKEALTLAITVVEHANKINSLEQQLAGYSLESLSEKEYDNKVSEETINDKTIYFVYEDEENEKEEESDYM